MSFKPRFIKFFGLYIHPGSKLMERSRSSIIGGKRGKKRIKNENKLYDYLFPLDGDNFVSNILPRDRFIHARVPRGTYKGHKTH